ncbi:MAG: amidohydrolase family protein [Congregibacter sp.]
MHVVESWNTALRRALSGCLWAATFVLCGFAATLRAGADAVPASTLPLVGHTEAMSFATSEGSWLSVDVSPDGETLYFDLLGDLYSLPIAGGAAAAITRGPGFDSQPRVSPDGRWLAFISDRDGSDNLWIVRVDGSEMRKLSDEQQWDLISPSWTPDGNYLLVSRNGVDRDLVFYHVEGGSGTSLAGPDDSDPPWGMGPVVSDDGRYVFMAVDADSARPVDNFPTAQIGRFDLTTGEMRQLTQGIGGGVRPELSPDGQYLAYGTRFDGSTGLRIRDLHSGADRWLSYPVQRDAQENYAPQSRDLLPGYSFTPDGKSIVLNAQNQLWRVDVATGEPMAIAFTVQVDLEVGPDLTAPYRLSDDEFTATIVQSPSLSPDGGEWVASVLGKLYRMSNEAGASPRRLTDNDAHEFRPVWSPDGGNVAFVSWSDIDGGHVWRIDVNGRKTSQQLTRESAFYTDLAFAPDGRTLFALRGSAFQRQQTFSEFGGLAIDLELVAIPVEGGEPAVIGRVGDARGLHFGPAGNRLYLSDESGLFSVDLRAENRRPELRLTAPRGNGRSEDPPVADSFRMSGDGRYALAFAQEQLWLMPMRSIGGAAPVVDLRSPSIPIVQLTDTGADYYGWSANGEKIWWSIGHTIYQRELASVRFAADETDPDNAQEPVAALADCVCSEPMSEQEQSWPPEPGLAREDGPETRSLSFAVAVSRHRPQGNLLLDNLQLLAMGGDTVEAMTELRMDQQILIRDGRIAAVGKRGELSVPDGTPVLDLGGRYVLPGFIDTHAHWEFRTDDVLEPHTWSLAANLAYGITTGLDVQTFTADYFVYRDMVNSGQTIGQRALMTGPGVFGDLDFESYAAVYHYLRRYSDHYRTHNIKSYMVGNRQQRQWIVMASKALGLMPTNEGAGDQRLDITHAIDGMHGNEHTLPDSPLGEDVVEVFARTRTAYTPTLIVQYNAESMREYFFTREDIHDDPKLRRFYPANRLDELTERRPGWQREEEFMFRAAAMDAAKIQRAGGLVGVGGHAELQGLGYHWEMEAFVMGGMTEGEVLRAATIDGATIIGVADDLGSVEVGKLADLLVLDKNPLDHIRNTRGVHRVLQNGRVYDGGTLDQLWPQSKPFPPFWWWDGKPSSGTQLDR